MNKCTHCEVCTDQCKKAAKLADACKAFADLTRLRIIYLLAGDGTGRQRVSDMAAELGISQPAVSQHLKILKNEGIVESERVGFHVFYTFNREKMTEISGLFNQMQKTILNRCDQETVRKIYPEKMPRICTIYYSYSGITRQLAEKIHHLCGGDTIEVRTKKNYGTFSAYTTGCIRSRKEAEDPITPEEIDVSSYDLLIIATPVWAWKPAPAANAIVSGLIGCEGKKAVVLATCCTDSGDCLLILRKKLEGRGVQVIGEYAIVKNEMEDPQRRNDLIRMIIDAFHTESHETA